MSTLSIRLKRRARILAAGVALSAATLAISPGVAEATGCGQCLGGNVNTADHTIGQVAVQNGANSGANINGSPNASLASPGSYQETANQQSARGSFGGAQQNTNDASYTVGQVAAQDNATAGLNANISPNASLASPSSYQETANQQNAGSGGGFVGAQQSYNQADHTIGQTALQDGVDLNTNANISPNVSVLSPGSKQEATNQQAIGASNTGGSFGGGQNYNDASYTVGQVAVQDGVDSNLNANISPNASVLSPGSKQKTDNRQSISGGNGGGARNDNSADHTIGQVAAQDGVKLNSNLNASPNASVLSPGSYQKSRNSQDMSGGNNGGGKDSGRNTNSARYAVGQAVLQDGVDSSINANLSPNASVLSPGSKQETYNRQNISQKGNSGKGGGTRSDNSAKHTIGQVAVQDGVDLNTNANLSPNASVLSPGSKQKSSNNQDISGGGNGATNGGGRNTNSADHTIGQVAAQDGVDSNLNANISPNASVLSPGSYQKSDNRQNITNGPKKGRSGGGERNTNNADYTVGQVAVQDGVDLNSNLNASPNASVLSPGSKQRTKSEQNVGGGSARKGGNEKSGGTQNTNNADHTVGQAVLQDGVDLSSNANLSPNASVLSPGSKQKTYNRQNISGGNNGGGRNTNSADNTVGQIDVQDGVDLGSNLNASPNVSTLSPGSKQKTDNCQNIGGGDCTAADNPGGGGDNPGNGPGYGNGPGDGTPPDDDIVPPPDNQPGDGPDDGGGGGDNPGADISTGEPLPGGPSPSVADVPEVSTSRPTDSPIFITTRVLEVPLIAAGPGMVGSAAIGDSPLLSASQAPVGAPVTALGMPASSRSIPQADGSDIGLESLPETGGELWMVALGLFLLLGGLMAVRRSWRRSIIGD